MSLLAGRGLAAEVGKPTEAILARLKHLLRFLSGVNGHCNVLRPTKARVATAWSDSDWAGERSTRKSVDCVVLEVMGAVLTVSTKGQMAIAQSSAEAELGGIHRAALLLVMIQNLWHEWFGEQLPLTIKTDAVAAKVLSLRRGRGRIRHLEVRQLWTQHLTSNGRLKIVKVCGNDNKADVGTKPHSAANIRKFQPMLHILEQQQRIPRIHLVLKKKDRLRRSTHTIASTITTTT